MHSFRPVFSLWLSRDHFLCSVFHSTGFLSSPLVCRPAYPSFSTQLLSLRLVLCCIFYFSAKIYFSFVSSVSNCSLQHFYVGCLKILDNPSMSVISVLTSIVFFHLSETFPGFGMTGAFRLKPGRLERDVRRLWTSSNLASGLL